MASNPAHIDAVADPGPGSRGYLKWFWTRGPGLAKWRLSPHPWTALKRELRGRQGPSGVPRRDGLEVVRGRVRLPV